MTERHGGLTLVNTIAEEMSHSVTTDGMASHATPAVIFRAGGREFSMMTVKGCKVCHSPWRRVEELAIYAGEGYPAIAAVHVGHRRKDLHLKEGPEGDDLFKKEIKNYVRCLRRHATGHNGRPPHMPRDAVVTRAALEHRAIQLGVDIETSTENLVEHMGYLQEIVRRSWRRMVDANDKTAEPTIADGIRASAVLANIEAQVEGGVDREMIIALLRFMLDWAQRLIPPDVFAAEVPKLARNPMIRSVDSRLTGGFVTDIEESESGD